MGQGFFESDDDYRARTAREANEQTIKDISGSSPSQGFFESDTDYASRVSKEASEHRIRDASGSAPSQGWVESDDSYRSRVEKEANEHSVAASTGHRPSQGWLESDQAYDVRVRKEANERAVAAATGRSPSQRWLEGDHEYRARVAHEAREATIRGRTAQHRSSESASAQASSGAAHSREAPRSRQDTTPGSGLGGVFAIAAVLVGAYYFLWRPAPTPQRQPAAAEQVPLVPQVAQAPAGVPIDWRQPPKLTLRGFGSFRIGMTSQEAAAVASGPLHREPMQENDCYFVTPDSAPSGIALMFSSGRLARIDITSAAYASLRGATVGQSQQAVLEMYGGRLDVQEHKYDDNGKYLMFKPTDVADHDYRMIFETNGQSVTTFRAGKLPEVAYVEGCL